MVEIKLPFHTISKVVSVLSMIEGYIEHSHDPVLSSFLDEIQSTSELLLQAVNKELEGE